MTKQHHKIFLLALPLTILLDVLIYAATKTCPSCGSFGQFITSEGALSFPLIMGITHWMSHKNIRENP